MARTVARDILDKIKLHAVNHLTASQNTRTNLSVDERVYDKGDRIGPPNQRLIAAEPTVVVFADDDPMANWGHSCRYLLYHADTGQLLKEVSARLPSGKLEPFFQPVRRSLGPLLPKSWPPRRFRCPIIIPEGNRYALLFAGFTMERHLNDMEFCYRTLIDVYGFPAKNIIVLSFDGTLNTVGGDWTGTVSAPAVWPGDGTPYRIQINGQGTLQGLTSAFSQLAGQLGSEDLLFIHTNNHGDNDSNGSFMGYPGSFPAGADVYWSGEWVNLYASTFGGLLSTLPKYRALMVMMEQCGSGGFGPSILEMSTAGETTFAAACNADASSYVSSDGLWDPFAYNWIAAMTGNYPNGTPLLSNPDTDGSAMVDAIDAYNYANSNNTVGDTPNFSSNGGSAGKMILGREYIFYWFWCWLLQSYLADYYNAAVAENIPLAAFYSKLNEALPALQTAIVPETTKSLMDLRRSLGLKIKEVIDESFKR